MTDWGLSDAADYAAAYALIRDALAARVVGHDEAIRMLALAGVRHIGGMGGERLLLVGPSGCGKSTLARALAEALGVPWLLIDVTMLSEQNWHGADLSAHLESLYDEYGRDADHAVIVADEIDKVCTAEMTQASKDYRLGKQQSLLPLLGFGSEIPLSGQTPARSDRMLILMAGVFPTLPPGLVSPGDLLRLGLMHEIVERMGAVIRLDPLEIPQLVRVVRAGLLPAVRAFEKYGFELEIADATLAYVASRVLRGDDAGPRSGVAWLRAAADRLLIRLLDDAAPTGATVCLRPDDVTVPPHRRSGGQSDGGLEVAG